MPLQAKPYPLSKAPLKYGTAFLHLCEVEGGEGGGGGGRGVVNATIPTSSLL